MASVVPESEIPPAPVLSVNEALNTFQLPDGFTIEAIASEPMVDTPAALDFDSQGRMWVVELRGYMTDIDGTEEDQPLGRIVVLTDSNKDGKADQRTVFLENIVLPRTLAVLEKGLLYGDQQNLYFVKRDDLKPVGEPEIIDPKYSAGGNVEHKSNGLLHGRDNWIYNAKSSSRYRQFGEKWVKESTAFRGQWGITQDDYGRLYHNTNSQWLSGDQLLPNVLYGNPASKLKTNFSTRLGSNRVYPSRVTPAINRAYIAKENGYPSNTLDPETHKLINCTAACGPLIYRGTNFPDHMKGWAFACESAAFLVKAIEITEKNGKLSGSHPFEKSEFLTSTDERFRPVNLFNAPDGSIYLVDMYHGIIQHKTYMTTYLRKQTLSRNLDKPGLGKGRIYRIRHTGKDLAEIPDFSHADSETLARAFLNPNGWHRDMAQRVLVERGDTSAAPFLRKLIPFEENHLAQIHAMWALEGLGLLSAPDLVPLLASENPKVATSAAYASLSLLHGERAKLIPALTALPNSPEILPYKARALASIKSPEALQAVAFILENFGDQSFVKQAAIAGMADTAAMFAANHPPKDKKIMEAIDQTIAGIQEEIAPETYLSGEHLASFKRGEQLYIGRAACFGCHGGDGTGLPNLGPTLDASDWVTGSEERLTKVLLHGLSGPININGKRFVPQAFMPGLAQNPTLSNADLADVLTYIRSAWSNRAPQVTEATLARIREETKNRSGQVYTQEDFK